VVEDDHGTEVAPKPFRRVLGACFYCGPGPGGADAVRGAGVEPRGQEGPEFEVQGERRFASRTGMARTGSIDDLGRAARGDEAPAFTGCSPTRSVFEGARPLVEREVRTEAARRQLEETDDHCSWRSRPLRLRYRRKTCGEQKTSFAGSAFRQTIPKAFPPNQVRRTTITQIAIVAYPGFPALDMIGPYECCGNFCRTPKVRFIWHDNPERSTATPAVL